MKHLITLVFALVMWAAATGPVVAQPASTSAAATSDQEQAVYITKTGKKYHRANCRYLSRSKIPTTLKDAKANRAIAACSVCNPAR